MRHMNILSMHSRTNYLRAVVCEARASNRLQLFVSVRASFYLDSLELITSNAYANRWFFASFSDKYLFVIFSWLTWVGFFARGSSISFFFVTISATLFGILDSAAVLKASQLFVTYASDTLSSTFGVLRSFTNHYFNSASGQLSSVFSWISNPHIDVDLTTNTDCEDMLAFFGDIVEFAEQDKALFVDAAFDVWFNLN
jgi:hypothetical protein